MNGRVSMGVGLRPVHYPEVLARLERGELGVEWLELITENYLVRGGRPRRVLEEIRARVPLALHGVSLDLGSSDPLDPGYLAELEALVARLEPELVSDHLCWTGTGGTRSHDLLPLPATEAVVRHVADRIARVQDRLGRRIAIENVSSYLSFRVDEMTEAELLVRVAERADCEILLDVNNVYVSSWNHGFDAAIYLDSIPATRVTEMHLAGHTVDHGVRIDTHDQPVCDAVWALYGRAVERFGAVRTLIEWDDAIPPWDVLLREVDRAREVSDAALATRTDPPLGARRPEGGASCGRLSSRISRAGCSSW